MMDKEVERTFFKMYLDIAFLNTFWVQGCWYVLSPTRLKKQLKGRHFSSDAEVIAAVETW